MVSFYAIFHTPRESHAETLKTLATYLPPGGLVLVTMGVGEWEGEEDFHGAPMWWSHYGADKNKEFIEGAGFRVIYEEIDRSGDERHQIILAEKNELRYIGSRTTVMRWITNTSRGVRYRHVGAPLDATLEDAIRVMVARANMSFHIFGRLGGPSLVSGQRAGRPRSSWHRL